MTRGPLQETSGRIASSSHSSPARRWRIWRGCAVGTSLTGTLHRSPTDACFGGRPAFQRSESVDPSSSHNPFCRISTFWLLPGTQSSEYLSLERYLSACHCDFCRPFISVQAARIYALTLHTNVWRVNAQAQRANAYPKWDDGTMPSTASIKELNISKATLVEGKQKQNLMKHAFLWIVSVMGAFRWKHFCCCFLSMVVALHTCYFFIFFWWKWQVLEVFGPMQVIGGKVCCGDYFWCAVMKRT